jgi:hypothetical protein
MLTREEREEIHNGHHLFDEQQCGQCIRDLLHHADEADRTIEQLRKALAVFMDKHNLGAACHCAECLKGYAALAAGQGKEKP